MATRLLGLFRLHPLKVAAVAAAMLQVATGADVHAQTKLAAPLPNVVYEVVASETSPGQRRFEQSLASARKVDAGHPYAQHIASIRDRLAAAHLPTDAEGVPVLIYEAGWGQHATMLAQLLTDPVVGLAPGVRAELYVSVNQYNADNQVVEDRQRVDQQAVQRGRVVTPQQVIDLAASAYYYRAEAVRDATRRASGERTTLVNMSFGTTPHYLAQRLLGQLQQAPKGSPAALQLARFGPGPTEQQAGLTRWVIKVLARPQSQAALRGPRDDLAKEAALARQRRVLIFGSAGNDRQEWMKHPSESANLGHGVPGLIWVGATALGADPVRPEDDRVSWFSPIGAPICAPGQDLPVGLEGDVAGTSFSSVYATATAALMLRARPELTPEEIEARLTRSAHRQSEAGDHCGVGLVEPVAAVREARDVPIPDPPMP